MAKDPSNPVENPGGYRPDDPRYGLSGQALQDYYLAQPPQWFIRSYYKPDSLHLREAAMDVHLAHLRAHADKIHFAGPLLSDDGETPIGTMAMSGTISISVTGIIRFCASFRLLHTEPIPTRIAERSRYPRMKYPMKEVR